jgi:protein-S-isoprenylcysteine O-methyltransferase Ste14
LEGIGSFLIVVGLIAIVIAMAWIGLPRSWGQQVDVLRVSGPYRVSRNPQILGGALLIVGVFFLQPSLYALGWVILCAIMLHMMALTEEEHLRERFGVEYEQYTVRVPRYLGIPKKGGP